MARCHVLGNLLRQPIDKPAELPDSATSAGARNITHSLEDALKKRPQEKPDPGRNQQWDDERMLFDEGRGLSAKGW